MLSNNVIIMSLFSLTLCCFWLYQESDVSCWSHLIDISFVIRGIFVFVLRAKVIKGYYSLIVFHDTMLHLLILRETNEILGAKFSGAGFSSKSRYMFGKVTVQIKLVEGDSAGTVTAFYVSNYFIGAFSQNVHCCHVQPCSYCKFTNGH